MREFEQVRDMTAAMVASYDERICAVGEIIEKSLAMLDQYRHAEQLVRIQLRETLAKVESLRKKDFDLLMAPILVHQEKREQEIKHFLNLFLKGQRTMSGQLKRTIQAGILLSIPDLEKAIQKSIEEAKEYLIDFQKEQAFIGEKMRCLFRKKEELTLKEFKETLDILCGELGLNKNEKICNVGNSVISHSACRQTGC